MEVGDESKIKDASIFRCPGQTVSTSTMRSRIKMGLRAGARERVWTSPRTVDTPK
jgi:hypothetical protein